MADVSETDVTLNEKPVGVSDREKTAKAIRFISEYDRALSVSSFGGDKSCFTWHCLAFWAALSGLLFAFLAAFLFGMTCAPAIKTLQTTRDSYISTKCTIQNIDTVPQKACDCGYCFNYDEHDPADDLKDCVICSSSFTCVSVQVKFNLADGSSVTDGVLNYAYTDSKCGVDLEDECSEDATDNKKQTDNFLGEIGLVGNVIDCFYDTRNTSKAIVDGGSLTAAVCQCGWGVLVVVLCWMVFAFASWKTKWYTKAPSVYCVACTLNHQHHTTNHFHVCKSEFPHPDFAE